MRRRDIAIAIGAVLLALILGVAVLRDAVIETGSTKKDIKVEICSKCHPFYTGKQKLVDTSGRVDKFNKKFGLK